MALTSDAVFEARLLAIRYATPEVSLFEFGAPASAPLPVPEPGAHVDVQLGDGIVRQYSLVTPLCSPSTYVVAVRRDAQGRGGSRRLHDGCRVGQMFRLAGPRNHFVLDEHAPRTLLLAGGIGITPVYSMFERLRALGRDVELHYWCRSPEHAVFRTELECRAEATLHYSREPQRIARTLDDVLADVSDETDVYCCGPARMLDDFARLSAQRPAARNHVERFAPASMPDAQHEDSGGFVVGLGRAGVDVTVGDGESILHALLREGIDVSYSCEEGVCGACETRVLDGQPSHRDTVRTPEEHARRGTMMICCSRSRSARLVLDL